MTALAIKHLIRVDSKGSLAMFFGQITGAQFLFEKCRIIWFSSAMEHDVLGHFVWFMQFILGRAFIAASP